MSNNVPKYRCGDFDEHVVENGCVCVVWCGVALDDTHHHRREGPKFHVKGGIFLGIKIRLLAAFVVARKWACGGRSCQNHRNSMELVGSAFLFQCDYFIATSREKKL